MFETKKQQLFDTPKQEITSENAFIKGARKQTNTTLSGNGALKYTTTGSVFIDQFSNLSIYKEPRKPDLIFGDMSTLYGKDPMLAVKFVIYLRLITRVTQLGDGSNTSSVQRGGGLRHEAIFRMMWLHIYHQDVFWKNIHLFIAAGSWRDVFTMLAIDLEYNSWQERVLDWKQFGQLIIAALEGPQGELVKKYLPSIKPTKKCTTLRSQAKLLIGKWLCHLLFSKEGKIVGATEYKQYRRLKSSGTAHQWQQLISKGRFLEIDFNTVHGRALSILVSGKFLQNKGLEAKFEKWIDSKPIAKFTGYPPELVLQYAKSTSSNIRFNLRPPQAKAFDKQFKGLIETAKSGARKDSSLIVVRDTSGSMNSLASGINISAGDVAKSLALFFSGMLPEGPFANHWIEFDRTATLREWKGDNYVDKWNNDHASYIGTTNFQSVIDLFCKLRTRDKSIGEESFPTGILCISDGEFNPTDLSKTNTETAFRKLKAAGFSKEYVDNFKIILWNVPSQYYGRPVVKYETSDPDTKNVFYFSGYDGSILAFLTGLESKGKATVDPKNAEELFQAAMDQELLDLVEI